MNDFRLGNHSLGADHPPFIIAEMSGNHNQSLQRALEIVTAAARAGAHALKIQTYTADTMTLDLDEGEFRRFVEAAQDLETGPLFIDDTALLTVLQLRAKARRLKAAHDIQAVFVDYLQLMNYQGKAQSRQEQITEISRGIKALARELSVPVIMATPPPL
jgi:replicative DNA helicase